MDKKSSAMDNSRRYTRPELIRSESLEGFKSSSFRLSMDHSTGTGKKKTCMCSPTTHPGSFRCSIHKRSPVNNSNGGGGGVDQPSVSSSSAYRSNRRRSNTMVEGELMKRALAAMIGQSSHQQRRRSCGFQPGPTRLSVMSTARDSR